MGFVLPSSTRPPMTRFVGVTVIMRVGSRNRSKPQGPLPKTPLSVRAEHRRGSPFPQTSSSRLGPHGGDRPPHGRPSGATSLHGARAPAHWPTARWDFTSECSDEG